MLASLVKGLCSNPHSPGRKPYLSRVKRVTPGISLGGTTPFKRDSGDKGLKQASPPVMPPDVEAKPRPERAPDGPAAPILSQPRLPRTGTRRSGQHPHPLSKTTPLPLHHLQQDLRRDS